MSEQNADQKFNYVCGELSKIGQVFVLDQSPQKPRCIGFKHYHSSLNESPLFDVQPERRALFNEHQDRSYEGLLLLLQTFGREYFRIICEAFNKPIRTYENDLARVWRVEQARLSDTFGVRAKIEEAFNAGGERRHSILEDRRADTRFAAYCLNKGMSEVVLQGQPTGYRAENTRVDMPMKTIRNHANKNVSDADILRWIDEWKRNKRDDEILRHTFVQQQAENNKIEGGVVIPFYGGGHFSTGTATLHVSNPPLEKYLGGFQRAIFEPESYSALLPENSPLPAAPQDFAELSVSGVRRLLDGVRSGKL